MYVHSSLPASDYHRDAEDLKAQGEKKTLNHIMKREKEIKMQKTKKKKQSHHGWNSI